jgi:hypothetical protein
VEFLASNALKPTSFIPPVVALVIAARSSGGGGDSPHPKNAPSGKPAKDKEPLDWKQIAAQFAEMQQSGGMGDMRTMMRFQQRLQAMTQEELVAALDEIGALDLPIK